MPVKKIWANISLQNTGLQVSKASMSKDYLPFYSSTKSRNPTTCHDLGLTW